MGAPARRYLEARRNRGKESTQPFARSFQRARGLLQKQKHDQSVVVGATDHVDQHQWIEPDRKRHEHGIAAEALRACPGKRDDPEARQRRECLSVQNATGTLTFASG